MVGLLATAHPPHSLLLLTMFLLPRWYLMMLIIASLFQAIVHGGPGPCATVDEVVLEGERWPNANTTPLKRSNYKEEWILDTVTDGMHVTKFDENNILLNAREGTYAYNFAKVHSSKFGESQWVWLRQFDSCTLGIKIGEVTGGEMYALASIQKGWPPNPNWHP